MLPYRPRTVQRCVRHVSVGSAGHDHNSRTDGKPSSRSWRSDSTVRSKSRSHPCTPATPQRRRPTRARSNTPEKETQNRIDFPRPASRLATGVVSQLGEQTASNQQASPFHPVAVKCKGNHSRWSGEWHDQVGCYLRLQMESWSPNKRPKIHGWKGSKNGEVIIIMQINLQAYWVIFGVSIGKIEFKNLISWSFWARIEGHP